MIGTSAGRRVLYTALIDPEIMKCELNTLMEEAGVNLYLHCWGALPIVEGKNVKGVIVENKSGRQAILAKVVIDCTGDGDLLRPAGAEVTIGWSRASGSRRLPSLSGSETLT